MVRAANDFTVGELFAGIGGFGLAAQCVGWTVKWFSEIDRYATAVYRRHFPDAENVGDITTFLADANGGRELQSQGIEQEKRGWTSYRCDVLTGGFPCQPVSVAGQQKAQDDDRWLWPHFARVIRILRPRYVVVENVPGLLARGMGDVLRDLAAIGYDAEWESLSAAAFGAPHIRDRVWIVAYPSEPELRHEPGGRSGQSGADPSVFGDDGPQEPVADATGSRCPGWLEGAPEPLWYEAWGEESERRGWWCVEPPLGRVVARLPRRVDRLRCLGNAIVPQIAEWIFRRIQERERITR
jgi:DNA (cytosine-5)-methyltransferase 1